MADNLLLLGFLLHWSACTEESAPKRKTPQQVGIHQSEGCAAHLEAVGRKDDTPVETTPRSVLEKVEGTHEEHLTWTGPYRDRPATTVTVQIAPRNESAFVVREKEVGFEPDSEGRVREEAIECIPIRLFVPVTVALATDDGHLGHGPHAAWIHTRSDGVAELQRLRLQEGGRKPLLSMRIRAGRVHGQIHETHTTPNPANPDWAGVSFPVVATFRSEPQ